MLSLCFGFRTGYHDLVRLYFYCPTETADEIDLYAGFLSFCRHEDELREELFRNRRLGGLN